MVKMQKFDLLSSQGSCELTPGKLRERCAAVLCCTRGTVFQQEDMVFCLAFPRSEVIAQKQDQYAFTACCGRKALSR